MRAPAIPPTLQQSLAARLDRLGAARETAQIGAVLGRDFSYALLRAVGGVDDPALQSALDRLAEADILIAEGVGARANYRFKHALIQDAAYDSLLKSRRQALHRRAAEALLASTDPQPELVAHHFTQSAQTELAIEWWGKAGDAALRRSAFQEAIAHLGKAIEMADKGEGEAATRETGVTLAAGQRLKLQTGYGQAMAFSRGFAAEETKAAVARAQQLAAQIDESSERFAAYYGQWAIRFNGGELLLAREIAENFLREARSAGGASEIATGGRLLGLTLLLQGDLLQARTYLEEALGIYDPAWSRDLKLRFGLDSGITSMAILARLYWQLGEVESAREPIEQAVMRAVEARHVPTLANVYVYKGLLEMLRGDPEATRNVAETLVEIAEKAGLADYLAGGKRLRGWARAMGGDREVGLAELCDGIRALGEQGNRTYFPLFRAELAELVAEDEISDTPMALIEEGLGVAQQTGEHWTDGLLHRIRGDILLKADPTNSAPAEAAFLAAIAVAQQQKARSFELRAALSLTKLYQSTGRPIDAHDVLGLALEGFSPTPEFPQIAEAKALLAHL